ncbi:LysR family transcriptional regulator [Rhodobacterales bacterium HKCCE3408]|nr:LysR family transcriptional regulator [Rhodobacterales bacterium HKCCE3408]
MTPRHLKIYRAISLIQRLGSIRKASESLAFSPSALNRALQGFEDEIGVQVFERIPGGVRLSAAGELLVDVIDRHLVEFDDLMARIGDLQGGLGGTLRVSVGPDLGAGLVPDVLEDFGARHPGVSVELLPDPGIGPLRNRRADVAVLTNPATDDAVEVLFSAPVRLLAWRLGGAGDPPPRALWQLGESRLVLPPHGTGTRIAVSHLMRKHRLGEGTITTVPAAAATVGIGGPDAVRITPSCAAGPGAEPLPIPLPEVTVCVLRRTRAALDRPAQSFLTLLQAALDAASAEPAPA